MRKYFNKQFSSKRRRRLPLPGVSPWEVLRTFIQGSASVLGFDLTSTFISISDKGSVKSLLEGISWLESELQLYTGSNTRYVKSARQLCSFLKKYPFESSDMPLTPRDVAIATFRKCEEKCLTTNNRLRDLREVPLWVWRAKKLIRQVLGPLEHTTIMKILRSGEHGPGSTISNVGKRVTEYYKYADFPYSVTKSASMYALASISSNPRWMDILEGSGRRTCVPLPGSPQYQKELQIFWDCTEIGEYDSITFVPKDAKTERPIAVGSSLNLFLQLGVKAYMEERLKKFGVDLTDQSRNQELARLGSLIDDHSSFVTLDLASASDTISFELVRLLLEPEWFGFLDDLRHKAGRLGDEIVTYQKFSAMGNGFTFPLESLIFWAICKASTEDALIQCNQNDIAVFGDDIIVRKRSVSVVISALEWSGFSVNSSKSFTTGPFRESCGADYYSGIDVRPIYLKRSLARYEDVYYLLNRIMELLLRRKDHDSGLESVYTYLYRKLDPFLVNFVPMDEVSDGGLRVPFRFLARRSISPWLSVQEALRLRVLHPGSPTAFYTVSTYRSRSFPGNERVRLLIGLREVREALCFYRRDVLSLDVQSSTSITRRDSVIETVRVKSTPNWDALFTPHELSIHPLFQMDS